MSIEEWVIEPVLELMICQLPPKNLRAVADLWDETGVATPEQLAQIIVSTFGADREIVGLFAALNPKERQQMCHVIAEKCRARAAKISG
ncbi:MAG: hypothetical protein F8N36_15345 [Desulfovibrio sp.]|uniref:hypothetical protein n=1 Tax=Desulfovibrio sp. TaxID=885 RepID=UPI00135EA35A|nr:hypothetical protein [Desulfovibrio sp.]MTJ94216.1 hypothetical protein [Desulfovibrio sp.]